MNQEEIESHITRLWEGQKHANDLHTTAFKLIRESDARAQAAMTMLHVLIELMQHHPEFGPTYARVTNLRVGNQLADPKWQEEWLQEYQKLVLGMTPPQHQHLLR